MADRIIRIAGRKIRVVYSNDIQARAQGGYLVYSRNGRWTRTVVVYDRLPPEEQRRVIAREVAKALDSEGFEGTLDRHLQTKYFRPRSKFRRRPGPKRRY